MMELVCPAGTPAALRAAVDAGAHTVYCGFADETNARNFPGLNFRLDELAAGVLDRERSLFFPFFGSSLLIRLPFPCIPGAPCCFLCSLIALTFRL